jgi:hypothetical protein
LNLENIERKLREAERFLERMHEREGMMAGDREIFDDFLNAFL